MHITVAHRAAGATVHPVEATSNVRRSRIFRIAFCIAPAIAPCCLPRPALSSTGEINSKILGNYLFCQPAEIFLSSQ